MTNFTSNTYILKRKILSFTNKISNHLPRPDRKFTKPTSFMACWLVKLSSNRCS